MDSVRLFKQFVERFDKEDLYNRKNFAGHITASAFITDENSSSLLFLHHKALNKWLQPGGHIDMTDGSIMQAALREASEETGISTDNLIPINRLPLDFDSHFIPPNIKKEEPGHYHHDIRYLFSCKKDVTTTIREEESLDSRWISLNDLNQDVNFSRVVKKILSLRQ